MWYNSSILYRHVWCTNLAPSRILNLLLLMNRYAMTCRQLDYFPTFFQFSIYRLREINPNLLSNEFTAWKLILWLQEKWKGNRSRTQIESYCLGGGTVDSKHHAERACRQEQKCKALKIVHCLCCYHCCMLWTKHFCIWEGFLLVSCNGRESSWKSSHIELMAFCSHV